MSANRFEYRDLALTVERGKVGQPSTVTLNWVTVDQDGQEHDRKLVLGCELLIDKVEQCRELTIVSVNGDADAVEDFNAYLTLIIYVGQEIPDDGWYEEERMHDVADALGRALLLNDAKNRFPTLFVKVLP